MDNQIIWDPHVIGIASGFLADDPTGLTQLLTAVDRLADDSRPPSSIPYGSPDLRRLRVGRYRILYEIHDTTIKIRHLGRTATD